MSVFRMVVKGGEELPIDFQDNLMVTISKGTLKKRPSNDFPVIVTIKYTNLPASGSVGPATEKLCVFESNKNEATIENMYYDSMNPRINVPEGAEVEFEGNFTSADIFDEKEQEEESVSTETPEDEEDGDFQEEETE